MKEKSYSQRIRTYQGAYKRYKKKFRHLPNHYPHFNVVLIDGKLKHLVVKTILVKLLRNRNYQVTTEQPIWDRDRKQRVADVYCVNTDTIFEIEGNLTLKKKEEKKKYGEHFNEIFIINLNEVPDNYEEIYDYLDKVI